MFHDVCLRLMVTVCIVDNFFFIRVICVIHITSTYEDMRVRGGLCRWSSFISCVNRTRYSAMWWVPRCIGSHPHFLIRNSYWCWLYIHVDHFPGHLLRAHKNILIIIVVVFMTANTNRIRIFFQKNPFSIQSVLRLQVIYDVFMRAEADGWGE